MSVCTYNFISLNREAIILQIFKGNLLRNSLLFSESNLYPQIKQIKRFKNTGIIILWSFLFPLWMIHNNDIANVK